MSWRGESAPSESHAGILIEGLHAVLCYAHRWWHAWDRQAVSDAAGKASFFVWLFAQSPQIYENYARSSVDGLSPTFLLQWMGGDITNLIGCLLTNQLAFQVAIAVYFCVVDAIIGIQFVYYSRRNEKAMPAAPSRARYASTASTFTARDLRSLPGSPLVRRAGIPRWSSRDMSASVPTLTDSSSGRLPKRRSDSSSPGFMARSGSWRLPRSSSIQSVETDAGQVSAAGHTVEEYANLRLAHAQQYVAAARRAAQLSSQQAEGRASSGSRQQPSTLGRQRAGSTRWAPHLLSPTREQSVGPETQAELHDYGAMADSLQSEASTASGGSLQRIWGSSDAAHKTRPAASFARFREQARARSIPTSAKLLSRISTVDESVTAMEDGEPTAVSDSESPDAEPRRGRGMIRTAERISTPKQDAALLGKSPGGNSAILVRGGAIGDLGAAGSAVEQESSSYFESRHPSVAPSLEDGHREASRSSSISPSRRRRASRGLGAALLGLGALWGVGPSTGGTALFSLREAAAGDLSTMRQARTMETRPSAALGPFAPNTVGSAYALKFVNRGEFPVYPSQHLLTIVPRLTDPLLAPADVQAEREGDLETPPSREEWDRIVGRLFAWICCFLYMTSRIPQIWTNFVRQSVEGLSMLLFVAAALGNTLYSISILVSPLATGRGAKAYLIESLPFLLGSGGTLIFDAIIVAQSIAWRHLPPEAELLRLDEEQDDPIAPEPGSYVARPGLSRRSSIRSAYDDVERTRSMSRPRDARESLRRSTSSRRSVRHWMAHPTAAPTTPRRPVRSSSSTNTSRGNSRAPTERTSLI
ncbi:hypothetical protein IE81DRAFT_198989 [Ceraceosorus guamensis]|uniref:PQ-loop-domain-containing protein n=1 Tax=Ceraceosorus guamensis TaxID=1522189 RepID=A0A316VXG3_9BASI|nr:hypothetical protein IE81DRAFT_198989 [Ceraceosorus guamensis]PWN40981.1 hypothetical protein IE81DRAFT_198989 [Ceraceosorus guamensis]